MFTVYLGGSICKEEEKFCREWRNKIKESFKKYDIKFIDPIEGKDLNKEYDASEIFYEDTQNVIECDLFVAEMTKDYSYIGTSIEIFCAGQTGSPVYVWGKQHEGHYFLQHLIDKRVDRLGQLIDLIYEEYQIYYEGCD